MVGHSKVIESDNRKLKARTVTEDGRRFSRRMIAKYSRLQFLNRYKKQDLKEEIDNSGLKYVYINSFEDGTNTVESNVSGKVNKESFKLFKDNSEGVGKYTDYVKELFEKSDFMVTNYE